ncbi:MAG: hypothetical protein ACPG1C_04175 [Alphaproteobacteria bacterium]
MAESEKGLIRYRILGQFQTDEGFLLLIDAATTECIKPRFGGTWHRLNSDAYVVQLSTEYEVIDEVTLWAETWWWAFHKYKDGVPEIQERTLRQVPGISNVRQTGNNEVQFEWQPRGLMRLRLLPEPKWGFRIGWCSFKLGGLYSGFGRSRMRVRKLNFRRWPTSRAIWTITRRIYELIFQRMAIGG